MGEAEQHIIRVSAGMADIDAAAWDALANPDPAFHNPFVSHAFLKALEEAGTVSVRSGWIPQHLTAEDETGLLAAMPLYVKTHSRGEYVFDHGWADAFARAGGEYYPKLQVAVPFTPVPGPRLLTRPGPGASHGLRLLASGSVTLAEKLEASSVHFTFLTKTEWDALGKLGLLQRIDQQFHWLNAGYETFDGFLATLASRKRKTIRKERQAALEDGITIEHLTGADITEAHWDAFFDFYMDTGSRKWGRPYLNRKFFSLIGAAMPARVLLILARQGGRYIAGALNFIGGDCLYGRYWGESGHHPFLHFEVCYYQAIDYAIAHKLARVEAGAQGEHKLARGYMPTETYSAHYIADAGLRRAVEHYLVREREAVRETSELLSAHGPFKKSSA